METEKKTMGWGITTAEGAEIWDAEPLFQGPTVGWKEKGLLLFYPKKWFLYRYIQKSEQAKRQSQVPMSILDIGCGTGAAMIDLKKMFGEKVDMLGVDVVQLQVDIAKKKFDTYKVEAEASWYDGVHLPVASVSIDAIHSSDVLGHVQDVPAWLLELHRVLRPGGTLAMFSESKLGKHAFIRRYLYKRGVNVDPHAEYHISLYSKQELKKLLEDAGFEIEKMYGSFWAAFFVHPDEMYPALQKQNKFFILKTLNRWLFSLKKKTHPVSTAVGELYGLVEMLVLGKKLETQGYIILAKKK